jgi:penicillin-binding protein 1A
MLWAAVALLLLGALGAGAALGGWFWISQDLPKIERLADYAPPAVTQVYAADGSLMAEFYRQRRYVVPMDQIPRQVVMAFVAAEDGEFFEHRGIDIWGIMRAAVANLKAGRVVQGGSTITQQVARGLLLTPARTIVRKLKEMILAWRMERYLTKEEILYLYLNQIYLGHGAYGVEAAARTYFGKHAGRLDVAEAALLAGLVQAPSRYSPLRHPRRARTRQVYVVNRMQADGHITPDQAQAALNRPLADLDLHRAQAVETDYYTEHVRQWLEERYGPTRLYEGGLTVRTACDPKLTRAGYRSIREGLAELTRRHGYSGPASRVEADQLEAIRDRPVSKGGLAAGQQAEAVVVGLAGDTSPVVRLGAARAVIPAESLKWARRFHRGKPFLGPGDVVRARLVEYRPKRGDWRAELVAPPRAQAALLCLEAGTGRARVLIGGRDFEQSQYNRAIQAHRQPGSAFKPFIYSAALDRPGRPFKPTTVIVDAPVVFEDPSLPGEKWKPKNYENRFYGPTTLRRALEHSRNVVTVKLLAELGLDYTIDYVRRFGIQSELTDNLSLALGTSGLSLLEMTRAYSVFANAGRLVEPVVVEEVRDRDGAVIYQARPQVEQAIDPQTAYLMTHLLEGVVQHGTGRKMKALGRPVAGKTGTTNDLRDAWFVGFTPGLVTGVWVGQDDNQPLGRRETGARAAGPIWLEFMQAALEGRPPADFPVPPGVVFARVDQKTGRPVPPGHSGGYFEAFREGHAPEEPAERARSAGEDAASRFMQAESFAPEGR